MATDGAEPTRGEVLAALSNAMVALQKQFAGKGPTQTRSGWVGDDMLVVLMGGGYTIAEETLYQSGRGGAVRDSRNALHDAMRQRMGDIIYRLTGREVIAYMSDFHQSPDLALAAFVLAPTEPNHPALADSEE